MKYLNCDDQGNIVSHIESNDPSLFEANQDKVFIQINDKIDKDLNNYKVVKKNGTWQIVEKAKL